MGLPTKDNVDRPVAAGYQFLVEYGDTDPESLYLRGAVGPGRTLRFVTVNPQEGLDTDSNPEDMRGETGRAFSRSSFTGGEGLDRAHRRNGTERDWSRFWDSRNVEVTPGRDGNPDEIRLLKAAANIRADDAGNIRMPMARIGTTLYMVCSSQVDVDRTANPTTATPTFTVEDPHAGEGDQNVLDLAALGDELYAAITTNDIHRRSSAGTWSHWSNLSPTRIWASKGRIIASTGAALYEAASGTGSTLLHTLASGETWTDVCDAGAAILAAATDGLIYAFSEENGELVLRAQTPVEGENPTALCYAHGFVFVGTGEATTGGGQVGRLWRAQLVGLRLRDAQVLREWGDGSTAVNRAPQRIISTRDAVYTGVVEDATESHLWKYHFETGGMTRDLVLADGLVQGLAVVDDRKFATVLLEGLWREATTYATSGYLISPLADFFNAAKKTWVGARLTTGTMPTDTDATLAYSTNPDALSNSAHSSWVTVISAGHEAANQGDLGETSIEEVQSRYIAGKLTLTPNGAATSTPSLLAFSFRGVLPPTEEDYQIPVNVSDRLEIPGRKPLNAKKGSIGDAVLDKLHDLKGLNATWTILRTSEEVVGQLQSISTPVDEIADKGSLSTFALLTIRGVRQ